MENFKTKKQKFDKLSKVKDQLFIDIIELKRELFESECNIIKHLITKQIEIKAKKHYQISFAINKFKISYN